MENHAGWRHHTRPASALLFLSPLRLLSTLWILTFCTLRIFLIAPINRVSEARLGYKPAGAVFNVGVATCPGSVWERLSKLLSAISARFPPRLVAVKLLLPTANAGTVTIGSIEPRRFQNREFRSADRWSGHPGGRPPWAGKGGGGTVPVRGPILNPAGTTCASPARCIPIDARSLGEYKGLKSSGGCAGRSFKPY